MSRALCRFSRFDYSRLPADKRAPALALQLPQWSPYRLSDYAIVWSATGHAMVWCWDRERLKSELTKLGKNQTFPAVLPETVLRAPQHQGLRVLACLEGFEAQQWGDGQLLVSRWWPQRPSAAELLAFQRDCSVDDAQAPAAQAMEPQSAPLAQRPWAKLTSPRAPSGLLAVNEMAAYALLSLALGLPALALLVGQLRLGQAREGVRAELAQLSERSRDVLAVREQALEAALQLRAIHELQRFPPPLVHMVAIARALPESSGAFLKEWELADGKLKILLASPGAEISGAQYVRALEQASLFPDVKIITQPDPRQIGFLMTLRTQEALALQAQPQTKPQEP